MEERRHLVEIIFLETTAFARTISEPERKRLYFDLMRGNGELIPNTGGLKSIRYGPYGHHGKTGREAVYAEYPYPDIQKWVFLLLNEFPLPVERTLSEPEKEELRRLKAKADQYIEYYYERLQEQEPNS